MKIVLEDTKELSPGIWSTSVAPHEIPMFGQPKATSGRRSVLLATAPNFTPDTMSLQFDAGCVMVLNVGTTTETIVIDAGGLADRQTKLAALEKRGDYQISGPGDREFLALVSSELIGDAREAAEEILREVRDRYPGDLQRGQRNNFKNTPDNFWYVIVQPRSQALSITVRGEPSRFRSSSSRLELKEDRPGYTRFTLNALADVQEALNVIQQSKRK